MKRILVLAALLTGICNLSAQRKYIPMNDGWEIRPALNTGSKVPESQNINLPHTWNAEDVMKTKDYLRTAMLYIKHFDLSEREMAGKRLFLYFEGVNSTATVFTNGRFSGEHLGGYTGFCLEITDFVKAGDNRIEVLASNAFRTDVAPLTGDFNVFGGIHRPVSLLVTDRNCISPLDYGSDGVYVIQRKVSEKKAEIEILTKLSIKGSGLEISAEISDNDGNPVGEITSDIPYNASEIRQLMTIDNPILWNGKKNPHLYTVDIRLTNGKDTLDRVSVKTGLRYFSVDPDKGFFLNGEYLDLYGFGKHEDMEGRGSALIEEDYYRDFAMVMESGATSMRFTHYPHAEIAYDLCDSLGLVVWSEIPYVGPGGFLGPGYIPTDGYRDHLRTVLKEMIRQKFNHPCVCFWGLSNELNFNYDDPREFSSELNAIAKSEDPSRLTVYATFIKENVLDEIADLTAYNRYFGWYEGKPEDLGAFLDDVHSSHRYIPVAMSEYGAGGSIRHHEDTPVKPAHESRWHPEEYQALCHEKNWIEMSRRPFVWGKYIWNFADFSSSVKDEGDRFGINDKGLVTRDRSVKKDAFYFYKANWSDEPMVYITSRRHTQRSSPVTDIKVYTNMEKVTLYVDGRNAGTVRPDEYGRAVWHDISLAEGGNRIEVIARKGSKTLSDSCTWYLKQ